ncbi:hypothetical protein [Paractinoplanes ferrugineus]|nr:hypothetical protein [Actinoplanes ferrugineus]
MDDGFDDHPKIVALLDEDDLTTAGVAVGLWTLCWTWAHRNTRKRGKKPGLIPAGLPRRFFGQAGKDAVQLLVKHRLWDPSEDGGWLIHDFEDFLPTEETREARAEAGRRGAAARWAGHQKATEADEVACGDGNLPSTCHEPASKAVACDGSRAPARRDSHSHTHTQTQAQEEDPPSEDLFGDAAEPAKNRAKARQTKATKVATRIPDDFQVPSAMVPWAAENAPLVDWPTETENFRDYWQAKAKDDTKKDWMAAWRTWMRRAQKDLEGRGVTRRWNPDANDQGRSGTNLARRSPPPPEQRSTSSQRAADILAIGAQIRNESLNGGNV